MKRHLNINRALMVGVALFCLFFTVNNVEAKTKYLCRYNLSSIEFACAKKNCKKTSDFYFSFEYDNGTYKVNLYDPKSNSNATNDENFARNNSFFLDKTTTHENMDSWNFVNKKNCPDEVWIRWEDNTIAEAYFGNYIEATKGIAFFLNEPFASANGGTYDKCTSQKVKDHYGNYPCKKLQLDATYTSINNDSNNKGNNNGSNNNGNSSGSNATPTSANTCIYASAYDDNLKDSIELVFNNGIVSAKHVDEDSGQSLLTTNINKNINECPQVLYEKANESSVGNDLYTEKPTGNNIGIYYLKKKFTAKEDVENKDSNYNTCISLGETKKYFVMILNILRFGIPTAIIVLSVIDFVGVVLSGESEKMEKAKKRFVTRLLVGILILFIPAIIELLLKLSGIIGKNEKLTDIVCKIF